MAGSLKLDGSEFLVKEGGQFKITNSELKLKSSGNTVVDSSGNAVLSESGGNVSIGNVRLPANGGIKDSSGNNVLSESGGSVTLGGVAITEATITGGKIDNVNLGTTFSAEANLKWNHSTDTYTENTTLHNVTAVHRNIKRCVLNADGTVNYYLKDTDSTKKADGTAANIDGSDGNVMVEIPKFWFRQTKVGNETTWEISDTSKTGYSVHPAFIKNGVEVSHRYIGAYSACYLDATDSTYKSGLYLEDLSSYLDLSNDKLSSVSGVYPIVGVSRAQCRSLAENNGSGWRICDFYLMSAVQLLYLIEYGTFNTQSVLGNGAPGYRGKILGSRWLSTYQSTIRVIELKLFDFILSKLASINPNLSLSNNIAPNVILLIRSEPKEALEKNNKKNNKEIFIKNINNLKLS